VPGGDGLADRRTQHRADALDVDWVDEDLDQGRFGQHDAGDPVGPVDGKLHRHRAARRVPDDVGTADAEPVEQGGAVPGVVARGERPGRGPRRSRPG
jgi:hypothetical protein